MSDTPRTDALCSEPYKADTTQGLLNLAIELSRDLERENARLREALTEMTKDRDLHYSRVASILFSGVLDDMVAANLGVMVSEYVDAKAALAAAVAREREECADVCDYLLANPNTGGGWSDACIEAAVAIRARAD